MILQALKEYYDRKAAGPESGIAPLGWELKEIPYLIVLDREGRLVNVEDTQEKIGKKLLMERRHKDALSTNIDFYSGFVYEMLGLPMELYTPLFAVARISGWSAHRMEELSVGGKLIRPRYECVEEHRSYVPMENR